MASAFRLLGAPQAELNDSGGLWRMERFTRTRAAKPANRLSDNFGHSNCVILREFVQTALFAVLPLTRSLTHVYGGIAQSRETFKLDSTPVRAAIAIFHR